MGATVTLAATPTTGYTFVGWKVADHGQPATAGACVGPGTCTVTMSGSKDVVAVFDGPPKQPVGTNEHHAQEQSLRSARKHAGADTARCPPAGALDTNGCSRIVSNTCSYG